MNDVFVARAEYLSSPHHAPCYDSDADSDNDSDDDSDDDSDNDDGIRRATWVNSLTLPRSLEMKEKQAAKQGNP